MDTRDTLNTNESFLEVLKDAFHSRTKVSLLFDDNGMARKEGLIKAISTNPPASIELENGTRIEVKKIIAINGLFLSDYSEC